MGRVPRDRKVDKGWTMPDGETSRRAPASLESERALLGSVLLDNAVMAEVGDSIGPEDFYMPKHADIWSAMQGLWLDREAIDIITLMEKIGEHPSVNSSLLTDLMTIVPHSGNAVLYAKRVRNTSRRRALIEAGAKITMAAYEENDSADAEEQAKQILLQSVDTSESEDHILTPAQQASLLVDMFTAKAQGVASALATGYPSLDRATLGGFRGGDLIVVAGRTGEGKSSYAENIAEQVAKRQAHVLYFNLEMSPKKMLERFAKRSARFSTSVYELGPTHEKDIQVMHDLADERARMPLTLVNDPAASSMSIRAVTARYAMHNGQIDLIVVDYLQLLKDKDNKSGSEPLRIARMTTGLKSLAREHDCPLILISQLNRNVEHRGGEPELHDLAHSGSIENDSDIVLMLWSDDQEDDHGNVKRLKIAKHRDGPTLTLPIIFDGASFKFKE